MEEGGETAEGEEGEKPEGEAVEGEAAAAAVGGEAKEGGEEGEAAEAEPPAPEAIAPPPAISNKPVVDPLKVGKPAKNVTLHMYVGDFPSLQMEGRVLYFCKPSKPIIAEVLALPDSG